jgi:hypothetical protein
MAKQAGCIAEGKGFLARFLNDDHIISVYGNYPFCQNCSIHVTLMGEAVRREEAVEEQDGGETNGRKTGMTALLWPDFPDFDWETYYLDLVAAAERVGRSPRELYAAMRKKHLRVVQGIALVSTPFGVEEMEAPLTTIAWLLDWESRLVQGYNLKYDLPYLPLVPGGRR